MPPSGAGFDVVVIGGGVAGAACAFRLAGAGAKVLVLEREPRFVDRVRGDVMYPWGVAEARRLGLGEVLEAAARPLRYWQTHVAGLPAARPRDLAAEWAARDAVEAGAGVVSGGETAVTFFHPELQEALILAAVRAGAQVVRGAAVTRVGAGAVRGPRWRVLVRSAGVEREVGADVVIGADGRSSRARTWGGFPMRVAEERLMFAGTLVEGADVAGVGGGTSTRAAVDASTDLTARTAVGGAGQPDTAHVFFAPSAGLLAMVLPLDERRTRVYAGFHVATGAWKLRGAAAFADFLRLAEAAGVPPEWLAAAERAGPLAQFSGADAWATNPYRNGFALLGDAAGASDPSFGCGMALAMRGARELAEAVLAAGSFEPTAVDAAGEAYAEATVRTGDALRRLTGWLRDVYREPGERADALRARLWPLFARDPSRVPDVVLVGPDSPSDEAARARFFGEDRP